MNITTPNSLPNYPGDWTPDAIYSPSSPIEEKTESAGHHGIQTLQEKLSQNLQIQNKITEIKQAISETHPSIKEPSTASGIFQRLHQTRENDSSTTIKSSSIPEAFENQLDAVDNLFHLELLLTHLAQKDTYNFSELGFIFEFSSFDPEFVQEQQQLYQQEGKNPKELKNWENIYIESPSVCKEFTPTLLQAAKLFLKQRPFNLTVQASAHAGAARSRVVESLKQMKDKHTILTELGKSRQDVYIHDQKAVYKQVKPQSSEEEENINHLFNLMSGKAVVGSFKVQNTYNLERFGIENDQKELDRGTPFLPGRAVLNQSLTTQLNQTDREIIRNFEHQAKVFDTLKDQEFQCKFEDETGWKIRTFEEINQLYLEGKIDETFQVYANYSATSFFKLVKEHENPFIAASLGYEPVPFILTPNLSSPTTKKCFEQCEKFKWEYTDQDQKLHIVDFKTLHLLTSQGELANLSIEISNPDPNDPNLPSTTKITHALRAGWKLIVPYNLINKDNVFLELKNVTGKPFIEMELLSTLMLGKSESKRLANILDRIDEEGEFNAVSTGQLQLLDLHSKNLGVRPVPNSDYEHFKPLRFSFHYSKNISFDDLHYKYLNEELSENTRITYKQGDQKIDRVLKDFPELINALEVKWTWVIFDTDLSLGEDNELQYQIKKGERTHLIPLRSVFLELNWKDKELSPSVIERLMNMEESDRSMQEWISKSDAPILKKLSQENRKKVKQYLAPLIKSYTLSSARARVNEKITIKDLQKNFSQKLSQGPLSTYQILWQTIQEDIQTIKVPVKYRTSVKNIENEKGEAEEVLIKTKYTWEELAVFYKQDAETLKKMNPIQLLNKESAEFEEGSPSAADFPTGESLDIPYDLLSDTDQAVENRMKIATQLFPRLTKAQQNAFIQRQENRIAYLKDFQTLETISDEPAKLSRFLISFVDKQSTPLSYNVRVQLQMILRTNRYNPVQLKIIRERLLDECKPTYFNLMKAMYPLLADAYELNKIAYPKYSPGFLIGHFEIPLEKTIEQIKRAHYKDREAMRLVSHLEQEISNKLTPSFFGSWQ